jgi:integrase
VVISKHYQHLASPNTKLPNSLVPSTTPATLTPEVARLAADAAGLIDQARAANTRRAYLADWVDFRAWCAQHGATPLPADPRVIALYLTDLAQGGAGRRPRKVTTLRRRLAALIHYHRAAGHELDVHDRVLRDTWAGIRRTYGRAPTAKRAAVTEFLRLLVASCPTDTIQGRRDRALLLVGFAGCFRRTELVSLDVADCALNEKDGLILTLRRSKTDQEQAGLEKGLPYGARAETCPVRALSAWLEGAGITEGPVFRPVSRHGTVLPQRLRANSVALIIKRAVAAAQLAALDQGNRWLADALDPARYAGHSLRAGFITSAAAAGVSESDIMRQSGHRRADTLRKYVRHATVFRHNAAAKVGL